MDRALDYGARSINLSAQLWRVERRKRYGAIPVRINALVSVYDDASDAVTRKTIPSNDQRNSVVAGIDRDKYVASIFGFRLSFGNARNQDFAVTSTHPRRTGARRNPVQGRSFA